LGDQSSWEELFVPIEAFAIWYQEHPYKISKGCRLNVDEYWFCQMLH